MTTMEILIRSHASQAGVSSDDILGPSRALRFVIPRQAAMADARAIGHTPKQIAHFFRRDVSTVSSALRRQREIDGADRKSYPDIRRRAVLDLHKLGTGPALIAAATGIQRARVHEIIRGERR